MINPLFDVSTAVAVLNQTLEYAYPNIKIVGELANFKVAKNKWIYADIVDENAKLRMFGTVYQLPGPLEDGMVVEILAEPRIHPQFGFSLSLKSIKPVGEGSIKKASDLLKIKLTKEGLFDTERKRILPYAPERVGLITSLNSAAYSDFTKIMNARWGGVNLEVFNAQVQGELATESVVGAINYFNQKSSPMEVLVLVRGGGSSDDLATFSTEQVTRAVAGSRIPTLVAIGHESDVSLAELASDMRASTPSNAAELLFPDKNENIRHLKLKLTSLNTNVINSLDKKQQIIKDLKTSLNLKLELDINNRLQKLQSANTLLESIHPKANLKRGYSIVRKNNKLISSTKNINIDDILSITMQDGDVKAKVKEV